MLLVCTLLTPMDDDQFLGDQNEVPNQYNRAYDLNHGRSAFSDIFTYFKGSVHIQR